MHLFKIAYLVLLQTIGQAYDDMQTQNQHLLQQITERDDYNIKVSGIFRNQSSVDCLSCMWCLFAVSV
jgi:hypothetical protein